MAGGKSEPRPRVWVLFGKGAGGNGQMLSLAEALGWPYEVKQLRHNALNLLPNLLLGATTLALWSRNQSLSVEVARLYDRLRATEGEPKLDIHPRDAAARGIADGDRLRVFNDRGSFTLAARVTEGLLICQ